MLPQQYVCYHMLLSLLTSTFTCPICALDISKLCSWQLGTAVCHLDPAGFITLKLSTPGKLPYWQGLLSWWELLCTRNADSA
jgi:hypothetical protein